MERIGIAGLSLHDTDVRGLEQLDRPQPEELGARLRTISDEIAASEVVLIATCNRIELVFAREVGHLPCRADAEALATQLGLDEGDGLRSRVHFYGGREAVRYLFRVASSLDSLVIGEDQILGQVREAFETARSLRTTGGLLGSLFEQALRVGKRVRTETGVSRHPVSVVSLGLGSISERFPSGLPRLALIGTGHMAELAARTARQSGLRIDVVVAGRSMERAQAFARHVGARATTLEAFRAGTEAVDALVSMTSAPDFVLDSAALEGLGAKTPSGGPLVAVDLAVPRDLEPTPGSSVEVVDLDTLRARADTNRALRAEAAARAEELVESRVDAFARRSSARIVADAVAELQSETEEIFAREIDSLFAGGLAGLDDEQRRAIERWARTAFGRVSHAPISAIKRLVTEMAGRDPDAKEDREGAA